MQWPTWEGWLRRHWAAKLNCSVGAWVVPTKAVCCSTLSLDTPCSSRIPGHEGNRVGWRSAGPRPHHSFGLNPSISYDEDFNHEPCRRKGHKAHWAVSSGGFPPLCPCVLTLHLPSFPLTPLTFSPWLWHLPSTLQDRTSQVAGPQNLPNKLSVQTFGSNILDSWPSPATSSSDSGLPRADLEIEATVVPTS